MYSKIAGLKIHNNHATKKVRIIKDMIHQQIPSVALAADADRAVVDMILTGIFRFTRMASYV